MYNTTNNSPLANVRNLLIDAVCDTVEFEKMGGMTPQQVADWFQDIVAADVEKILSQRV